jgi:hypothetical protein
MAAIIGEAEREIFLQKAGELIPTFEHLIQNGAFGAGLTWSLAQTVLVQILLSVCLCRVNDFPEFRLPRPWPTFPERWLLFRLVV